MSQKKSIHQEQRSEIIQSYLMISPLTIGFILFSVYPIVWVLRYAWFEFDGVTSHFIGLDNFIRVFMRDGDYWSAVWNTIILSLGKLSVEIPLALLVAVFLNMKIRGSAAFRVIFFMPTIISTAIIGLIFYFIFASYNGILNNVLLDLHLIDAPINWFNDKWRAMTVLAVASIWNSFGINMIFFLTGLQTIPVDLYECAVIDGANGPQKFFHITLPMLYPIMQIIIMLALIGSMKVTDLVLVLTNGQPAGDTEVVMTYVFKYFFNTDGEVKTPEIGYASALGMVTACIIALITLVYLWVTRRANRVYEG